MADYIDAGKLNKAAQVLELRETAPGVWEWTPVRRAWASITFQSKTNLFSKVGIGARDAAVIVRRQPLTLHHALRWGDTHLFLTSIVPMGRNHLEVDAAVVKGKKHPGFGSGRPGAGYPAGRLRGTRPEGEGAEGEVRRGHPGRDGEGHAAARRDRGSQPGGGAAVRVPPHHH